MTVNMKPPLSAQSEVVNTNRRWNQDWYTWLSDLVSTVNGGGGGSGGGTSVTNVKDFGAVGDGVTNDTAAIQAALDSGKGNPITVYFPPGTYKVYPPTAFGVPCLVIHYDNVTMVGCGPTQSIIKCYVSGGRDPNLFFDAVDVGYGQAVWRGPGILLRGFPQDPGVRANTLASTGKLYFEWTVITKPAGVGLSGQQFVVKDALAGSGADFLGGSQSAAVWSASIFINSLTPAAALGVTTNPGDTLAIAVDLTARLLWAKNITQASAWNGSGAANPATGVGGLSIASLPSTVYPTADMEPNSQVSINLGASAFAGAIPSGFVSWPGGAWNPNDMDNIWISLSNSNLTATRINSPSGGRQNTVIRDLRLTGQCLRSTATWPFGTGNPPPTPGLVGPHADGWDVTHHGLHCDADQSHNYIRIHQCEMDGWKGEVVFYGGTAATDMEITRTLLHDTNADVISCQVGPMTIADNIIHDGTNILENSPFNEDLIVRDNYCYNFSGGFTVTNQTDPGGDADINGKTVIEGNMVIHALGYGVQVQNYANQVWIKGNTFLDCGHFSVGMDISPFKNAPTTSYTGSNIVIEDNQFYSQNYGLNGINISIPVGSTPVTQLFVRRNRFLLTPASQPGGGFSYGVQYLLQPGCILFVEDNDCSAIMLGNGAFKDLNPSVGQVLFRRNVHQLAQPIPDRVMLYTQFDKTNNTTLNNVGMTSTLGLAGIYTFTARLYVSANASGGAKVAVAFSGVAHEFFATAKLYTGTTLSASGSTTTNGASIAGATAAVDSIEISGYIVCSKVIAEAGSLDVQFAQNAAFGTASSVLKGSFLSVCESQYQSVY